MRDGMDFIKTDRRFVWVFVAVNLVEALIQAFDDDWNRNIFFDRSFGIILGLSDWIIIFVKRYIYYVFMSGGYF